MIKNIMKKRGLILGALFVVFAGVFLIFIFEKEVFNKKVFSVNKQDKQNEVLSEDAEIIFVGDLMFDRYIREVANRKGNDFILKKITDDLNKSDFVVANLEGPITDKPSKSIGSEFESPENYIFTFNPNLISTLQKNNIKLVNIGNNHILNFGKDGLEQTIDNLKNNSIEYFGDVRNNPSKGRYRIIEINKIKIGFVNYNQFSKKSSENALEDIRKIKNRTDFVVVYTHWGKEYENKANISQKKLAHSFIDEGADLIIGSHPHVVQEREIYNEKLIYYSLGNFVFDQYFKEETKRGLIAKIKFNKKDGIKIIEEKEIFMLNNGQTVVDEK
jgi:poly-gamma-glutamate capsule biosynthesis protein CapA/YwtB (metallophosphatase superfamily)